jgi:predicted nucleotidyltransferase component of viral defense system
LTISKEGLLRQSEETGFRPEILEKVLHLISLLNGFSAHPFLRGKLALKGGTALNLFVFQLPRLSIDIDVNYIGGVDLDTMRSDRPKIEKAISAVCEREGLSVGTLRQEHAGDRWVLRYQSALGGRANLKLEVNFMFRAPFWPIRNLSSSTVGGVKAGGTPVLDLHELAAGKLAALLSRHASRDLFDAHELLTKVSLDQDKLRFAFVVYGAINRKDWRTVAVSDVNFEQNELRNELLPVLRHGALTDASEWATNLVQETREALGIVLPLANTEQRFLDALLDKGEIEGTLLTDDAAMSERIKNHPGLLWKATNVRLHMSRRSHGSAQ